MRPNPNRQVCKQRVFEHPVIDWHRARDFQRISLVQIVRRMFPHEDRAKLYIPGGYIDKLRGVHVAPPRYTTNIYYSEYNRGAKEVVTSLVDLCQKLRGRGHEKTRRPGEGGGEHHSILHDLVHLDAAALVHDLEHLLHLDDVRHAFTTRRRRDRG